MGENTDPYATKAALALVGLLIVGCTTPAEPGVSTPPELGADTPGISFRPTADESRESIVHGAVPIADIAARRRGDARLLPSLRYAVRDVNEVPSISETLAVANAKRAANDARAVPGRAKLVFVPREELRPKFVGATNADDFERVIVELRLSYRVPLDVAGHPWVAEIDAHTGQLARMLDQVDYDSYANVIGWGAYSGKVVLHLLTDVYEGHMAQDVFGNQVWGVENGLESELAALASSSQVYAQYSTEDTQLGDSKLYLPANGVWSTNGETAAADAMFAATLTWRTLNEVFGRAGPNGANIPFRLEMHHQIANAGFLGGNPKLIRVGYASLTPDSSGRLKPRADIDTIAHEMGHDLFRSATGALTDPWSRSEFWGMNEATGDILAVLVAIHHELLRLGLPASAFNTMPFVSSYGEMNEQLGAPERSMLTPEEMEWFPGIGESLPHVSMGPITRMFLLLAYGCIPEVKNPASPWACPRVPNGFAGIGPYEAGRIWIKTLELMSLGASFSDAKHIAVDHVARPLDGNILGTRAKATNDAFAAINVGLPADRTPPTLSLQCSQSSTGLTCSGTINDSQSPTFTIPPKLKIDGVIVATLNQWQDWQVFIPSSQLQSGNRVITLEAWDLWDNKAVLTIVQPVDFTAPTVAWYDDTPSTGSQTTRRYWFTASDASEIVSARVLIDGVQTNVNYGNASHSGWTFAGQTAVNVPEFYLLLYSLAEGPHELVLEVKDKWGFTGTRTRTFVRDRTPPAQCTLYGVSQDPADWSRVRFTAHAQDPGSGVSRLSLSIDGSAQMSKTNPGFSSAFTWTSTTLPLAAAQHSLKVYCRDAQENGVWSNQINIDVFPPCGTNAAAGGGAVDVRSFNMGAISGSSQLTFRTWGVHDRIRVFGANNAQLLDTGCVATGDAGGYSVRSFSFSGTATLTVRVDPNCDPGTATPTTEWDYQLHCPN